MNADQLTSTLNSLEGQLADAEAEAKTAVQRVEAIHRAIDGLREVIATLPSSQRLFPPPPPVAPETPVKPKPARKRSRRSNGKLPRGREAVRRVLIEARKTMTTREIVAALHQHGWMLDLVRPGETVAVTAKRLVSDGEVERVGEGRYRYRVDKLPPAVMVQMANEEEARM